jgi:two-component sensor histidine kinase
VGPDRPLLGLPAREALPEIEEQGFVELLDQVYRTGQPHIGRAQRVMLQRNPDAPPKEHFVDFIYQPITDGSSRVVGIFSESIDVTDHKRALDHQGLLIHELNHRVKNSLATVQSIVYQSLRHAKTMQHAQESLESRLMALARVHDLLTQESWESADLRTIVHQALLPFEATGLSRFTVSGPPVRLLPRQVLPLAMAIHELLTNAVKYGALSLPTGHVDIVWDLAEDQKALVLTWRESGGPVVRKPTERGFGTRLIERSLAHELEGVVDIAFEPSGVICTVRVQLSNGPA